jgi:hypothetical protein
MTEEEITQAIQKWWLYALVGNPEEADYGPDTPQGYIAAGLESQYRCPQPWETPEPRKVATIDDFNLIEPIFRRRDVRDRLTICYYTSHPARFIARNDRETMQAFRADVGRP